MVKASNKYPPHLIIMGLYTLTEIILWPVGEFALNDDWAYAIAIKHLLDNNVLMLSNWQAIPALPQLIGGVAVCKVLGFSFTALRLLTVASVWPLILIANAIMRRVGINPQLRLPALAVIVFNPLLINLSNTFMPDVFQLVLGLSAFYFMIVFFENRKRNIVIPIVVFCLLASLQRQSALCLPFCFAAIAIWRGPKRTVDIALALLPLAVCFAALVFFEYLLAHYSRLPANYNLQLYGMAARLNQPFFGTFKIAGYYLITSTICLGLIISPLFPLIIGGAVRSIASSWRWKLLFAVYMALVAVKLLFSGNVLPFVGNIFYHAGVGPIIMTGLNTDIPCAISILPKLIYIIFNIVGACSFFAACFLIVKKIVLKPWLSFFLILLMVTYLLPICINYANDRYLLFIIPFLSIVLVAGIEKAEKKWAFVVLFGAMFCFAMAAELDYLSFNKARNKALNYLETIQLANPRQIDGGFEYNGWHLSQTGNYNPNHTGKWWWVDGDEFTVSPLIPANYSVLYKKTCFKWLEIKTDTVYALQKHAVK